jgi:hypothetical protein
MVATAPRGGVRRTDIDQFIAWQQTLGRARATINRPSIRYFRGATISGRLTRCLGI